MSKQLTALAVLLLCALTAAAQTHVWRGTVVDDSNDEPLIGATVMPVGQGQGTMTDIEGAYTLTLPTAVKQIKVSYIGYKTVTVNLADNMTVRLKASEENLQDLVVVGYGSAKQIGSVVGSVAVVGEKTFENLPTANFIDAMQGQVAGLNIYSNSGDPSSTSQAVNIRGINSLNAGNAPLYVLDGAPVDSSVFTTLNPNDIMNVTVLKGASAVAIYGSRASNGVIVITSKKGSFGTKPRVNISASYGWSQMVGDNLEMMNSAQYVEFRDKIGMPVGESARNAALNLGISTDWRAETFDSHAPTWQLNGSVTGGGDNLSYFLSLNHNNTEGIIAQSGMRRETLRASINSRVNDWLRINFAGNLGYTKYETNSQISSSGIYTSNPMVFARFTLPFDSPWYYTLDDAGRPVYGAQAMRMHYSQWYAPDFVTETRDQQRTNVTANVTLSETLTPLPGLIIKAQQNVDAYDYKTSNLSFPYMSYETPMGDVVGSVAVGEMNTGSNSQSFSRRYQWTYTHTAEYNFQLNDIHNITLLAGEESIFSHTAGFGVISRGQLDQRLMQLSAGTSVTPGDLSDTKTTSSFNSFFFKAEYDYANRYFAEASIRRDGSSKFAPGHRWSTFWSAGVMWNAKNEKFLQDIEWLRELQVRASMGTTGNSFIEDYLFFGSVGNYPNYGPNAGSSSSTGLGGPSSHDLTWETVHNFDAGVHFNVFNRLSGDIEFYRKKTTDMLMAIPWSFTTGYDEGWGNIGSMTNTGVDITLDGNVLRTRDWDWNVRVSFNYNRNRITELFNGRDKYVLANTGTAYQVGHMAGELYAVRYLGVDPADGKQVWLDKNDNPTKVWNEEANSVMTGKSYYAPLTGGFGTNVRWKGLALQVDFNWAAKKYMTNNDAFFLNNAQQGASNINQTVDMLNVWTKPGDITDIPGPSEDVQFDTRFIENASFLRLKTLTLSYMLPKRWMDAARLNNVVFHFTGRNLLTFTGFSGYDPEPQGNLYRFNYPNTRIYELGVDIAF